MTMNQILQRLEEGTLIRNAWTGYDDKGRDTACLYAALVPGAQSTEGCPAHLMPQWVADLTLWIDDAGTEARWPEFVTRYAMAQSRWSVLTDEQWAKISRLFRAECAISALAAAAKVTPADAPYWPAVVAASEAISGALLAGDEASAAMNDAARVAWVEAEAEAAAWAAVAAWVAAEAAAEAEAAAWAAVAVWVSAGARAAEVEAAAAEAAADHLINHFLTLVETELGSMK